MILRKAPASLLAGYVLFGLFMVLESALRQGGEAQSSTAGRQDQGTTRTLGTAHGAGLLIMPLLAMLHPPRCIWHLSGDEPPVLQPAFTLIGG